MPELPEVETIKLGLQKKIVGLSIGNLQVLYPKGVQFDPKEIEGKKIIGVWRRAKMLGVDLDSRQSSAISHQTLLFHLKMTGQLIYIPNDKRLTINDKRLVGGHPTPDMRDQMPIKSTVAVFEFDDGSHLYFNDQRRFGWIKLINRSSLIVNQLLEKLGPEPLEKEFTWEILKANLLKHKSQPIKVAIMDQSVLSGVGNIYASEALFDAKIDPRRKVSSLSDSDFQAVFGGIREALNMGIKHGGSSLAHFVDADGKRGYFLDYANVYGKEGYKCNSCSGKVQKIQQAGRGTYFCEHCQK